MKIHETGKNLTVLINCQELSKVYDWLTFATWYTTCRSMPDAHYAVSIPKQKGGKEILFPWLDRCKIKKLRESTPEERPLLKLKAQAIQLRQFYPEEWAEINSNTRLVGENCELISGNNVKSVSWLSSRKVSDNPVFLITDEKIGALDVRGWASQSRDPIFAAKWKSSSPEEVKVQSAWNQMSMFYSFAIK